MKKVNLFLVSLVTLVTLGFGFSSCDGGIQNKMKVVDKGDGGGCNYVLSLQNTSKKTLNGVLKVKVNYYGGTSGTKEIYINNMEPGDVQEVVITENCKGVNSWKFVE